MKKIFHMLHVVVLLMLMTTACTLDSDGDDIKKPDAGQPASYEVTSDQQVPMSLFLGSIPAEYTAFKEPLEYAFTMRENALEQALGIDIQLTS